MVRQGGCDKGQVDRCMFGGCFEGNERPFVRSVNTNLRSSVKNILERMFASPERRHLQCWVGRQPAQELVPVEPRAARVAQGAHVPTPPRTSPEVRPTRSLLHHNADSKQRIDHA